LHVTAALMHKFVQRDNVMSRMASPMMLSLFTLTVAVGVGTLSRTQPSHPSAPTSPNMIDESAAKSKLSALPAPQDIARWKIDYEQSYIRFRGEQAGAEFGGEWLQWQAAMYFDAGRQLASFDVTIDVSQPDTADTDRDTTLLDAEWFAVDEFPLARFQLTEFKQNADELLGNGLLQIKQHLRPLPFMFTVTTDDGQHTLVGTARIDRLAFGLGLGEWEDTTWVGQYVDIEVKVMTEAN